MAFVTWISTCAKAFLSFQTCPWLSGLAPPLVAPPSPPSQLHFMYVTLIHPRPCCLIFTNSMWIARCKQGPDVRPLIPDQSSRVMVSVSRSWTIYGLLRYTFLLEVQKKTCCHCGFQQLQHGNAPKFCQVPPDHTLRLQDAKSSAPPHWCFFSRSLLTQRSKPRATKLLGCRQMVRHALQNLQVQEKPWSQMTHGHALRKTIRWTKEALKWSHQAVSCFSEAHRAWVCQAGNHLTKTHTEQHSGRSLLFIEFTCIHKCM